MDTRNSRKVLVGIVTSDKMQKTITVKVEIVETRPISKTVNWRISKIIEKAK